MLDSVDEAKLDSLSQMFRSTFRGRLPDVAVTEAFTDRLMVTIPAKHPAVGDMVVLLDGDEVTISVGSHFHTHFDTDFDENSPLAERERLAASRAVDFIALFLTDALRLRVRRERGSVVAAEVDLVGDQKLPPGPGEADYLWSGPQ